MSVKNFLLSHYKNATSNMHVQIVKRSKNAQEPHTHDYFQMYLVTKGSVAHFTNHGSAILLRGDMLIVPPKCVHYIDQSKDSEFYSFSFTPECLSAINAENSFALDFIWSINAKSNDKVSFNDEQTARIESTFSSAYVEFTEKGIAHEEVLSNYLNVLITVFARKYVENDNAPNIKALYGNTEQIKRSIEYVNQNFAENFTLRDMAQYSALSVSVFCKAFKQISGYTFNEYLHRARISAYKKLISKGVKITVASGLVGYREFSTFYRNFKKITGYSPEEYLKRIKI